VFQQRLVSYASKPQDRSGHQCVTHSCRQVGTVAYKGFRAVSSLSGVVRGLVPVVRGTSGGLTSDNLDVTIHANNYGLIISELLDFPTLQASL
jgi:hypothetical protein